MGTKKRVSKIIIYIVLAVLTVVFVCPLLIILMNSFKGKFFISDAPFKLPTFDKGDIMGTFAGIDNYSTGIIKTGFLAAFGRSLFITTFSVLIIVLFTSMTAWFIVRIKNIFTKMLYFMFVFSMIVPFQMVMFPMSKITNMLGLSNPIGILFIYLGFGSGLSVFMFAGFIKSIPVDIEEAATIDGCNPLQLYFNVVLPLLKPTAVTVAILNAMWIWNDYLLPLLVLGSDYATIPMAIQSSLTGSYGGNDMGALMAMLVISIIPIIVFYFVCQKQIIKGVIAGAVKG